MNENTFVDTFFFRLSIFWFHFFFLSAFLSSMPFQSNQMDCEIINHYFNIFFIEIYLKKENLKSVFWAPEFGHTNRSPKQSRYVTDIPENCMNVYFISPFFDNQKFYDTWQPCRLIFMVVTTFGHKRIGTQRIKDKRWNKSWDLRDLLSQAKKATQKIAFLYITI